MASYAEMEIKECASCEHEFFCDPNSGAVYCNDCHETAYTLQGCGEGVTR